MNKLPKAQFIVMWSRALSAYIFFWAIFISLPAALFTLTKTRSESLAWVAAIASPILACYLFQLWQFKTINKHIEKIYHQTLSKLKHTDYYYNTAASVIALDVDNRQLSVLAFKQLTDKEPASHIFNLNDIEKVGVIAESHTEFHSFATGLAATFEKEQVRQVNEANATKARLKTGLHLFVSDVMISEIIIPMRVEDARRWVHLLQKLGENTLEKRSTPTMFPPDAKVA